MPFEEIPEALGALEKVRAILWTRLIGPRRREMEEGPEIVPEARLVTARELAEKLGMSTRWVYRNQKRLGVNVRFTEQGVRRYLAERR